MFVRLVKYALQALDIYTINLTPAGQTYIRQAAYVSSAVMKTHNTAQSHYFPMLFSYFPPFNFSAMNLSACRERLSSPRFMKQAFPNFERNLFQCRYSGILMIKERFVAYR